MRAIILNKSLKRKLAVHLLENTENLMTLILDYAEKNAYTRFTSTLKEAWRMSIEGLTESICSYLESSSEMPEIHADKCVIDDPISVFGVMEARKHRERGISLELFLGLFKYYQFTYVDVVQEMDASDEELKISADFINRAFNRIEIAFVSEWMSMPDNIRNEELAQSNRVLANEKNKYLTIFESVFTPLIYTDTKGHVLNMNDSAMMLFAPEKRSGSLYYGWENVELPKPVRAVIADFIHSNNLRGQRIINLRLNGEGKFFEIRMKRMMDVSRKFSGVTVGLSDITELKQLLEKSDSLETMNEELSEKVKLETEMRQRHEDTLFQQKKLADMGHMISAIAHQWRQPLNALGLYIQHLNMVYSDDECDKEYISEFTATTLELIQDMSRTVEDFRNFFKQNREATKFDAVKMVVSFLRLINAQLVNRKIVLCISCRCNTDVIESTDIESFICSPCGKSFIKGFEGEFKQVIANIVYNAVDAIESNNGGMNGRRINITFAREEKRLVISIKDTGTGIPENVASRIFDPYYTTKSEGSGTGIGLYMSKIIIEKHMRGRLSFYNGDSGAVFEIDLPLYKRG